jgi:hypothetical protein
MSCDDQTDNVTKGEPCFIPSFCNNRRENIPDHLLKSARPTYTEREAAEVGVPVNSCGLGDTIQSLHRRFAV